MGLKYNSGNGAGTCDKCGTMLWTGFVPNVTSRITPFNFYKNGEMFCRSCDPYLAAGVSKEVVMKYDGSEHKGGCI